MKKETNNHQISNKYKFFKYLQLHIIYSQTYIINTLQLCMRTQKQKIKHRIVCFQHF